MECTSIILKRTLAYFLAISCTLIGATSCEFVAEESASSGDGASSNDTPTACTSIEVPSSGTEGGTSDLRTGKYLWDLEGNAIDGSMVEHGAVTITDATESYEAGYVESISVDTFFASSICSGTDVLGVAGSATCGASSTPSASTICTGTTILGVAGAGICLGSAGSGTIITAPQLCSNYYAYGSSGSAIDGSRSCNEVRSTNYAPSTTNLLVWLQADVFKTMNVTSSATIKTWPDLSGNTYSFIDSGSINEPSYFSTGGSNNKPYLDFGGSNSDPDARFSDVAINDINDISIFVVAKPDDPETTSMDYMLVHGGSGGGAANNRTYSLAVISRKLSMAWEYSSGTNANIETNANFTNSTATTIWALMSAIRDDTNKLVDFRYNNSTQTVAYTNSPTSGTSGILRVGAETSSSGQFDGGIAEILIYSEIISGSNLTQVNCYLSEKYGLGITGC